MDSATFIRSSSPKRKRGNELTTTPRSRFGLQKRSVFANSGAVQLSTTLRPLHACRVGEYVLESAETVLMRDTSRSFRF